MLISASHCRARANRNHFPCHTLPDARTVCGSPTSTARCLAAPRALETGRRAGPGQTGRHSDRGRASCVSRLENGLRLADRRGAASADEFRRLVAHQRALCNLDVGDVDALRAHQPGRPVVARPAHEQGIPHLPATRRTAARAAWASSKRHEARSLPSVIEAFSVGTDTGLISGLAPGRPPISILLPRCQARRHNAPSRKRTVATDHLRLCPTPGTASRARVRGPSGHLGGEPPPHRQGS